MATWFPTIYIVFTGKANSTSINIGVVGSHEMADKGYVNIENSQMVFTDAILALHITQSS